VTSYTIGFPTDWVKWHVGEGPSREYELSGKAADGPEAQVLVRHASWDLMLERAKAFTPQRGFKVFDRAVEVLTLPAGPAIGAVTVLAEHHGRLFGRPSRPEPVQTCVDITVFPPGSSDVLCLELRTFESDLLDALGDAARVIAQTITVGVGPPRDS